MLKKIQNDKAESRYWETLEHYRRAMEQNPALTLKAYCQMSYVYHRGLLRWMRKEGIKKPVHKTSGTLKCRVLSSRTELRYDMGEVFIQIYPDEYLLRLQKDKR